MKKLLIQCQLSNYDDDGNYILNCDSGFNMNVGRAKEMLKLNKDLKIDFLVSDYNQTKHQPAYLVRDILDMNRVKFIRQHLTNHAIKTRYDFHYNELEFLLNESNYTHLYLNDPCLVGNYKTLFYKSYNKSPKIISHNHFVDLPENPKVPLETSYYFRQIEGAIKADINLFQCESAMNEFFDSISKTLSPTLVDIIKSKSEPYDDGYSYEEINKPIIENELRFKLPADKVIIFVPNRIGRTFDYTNCGKFLFEFVNDLYKERQDFVIVAGNPSQKISNEELAKSVKPYVYLVKDTFSRNEYRYVARNSDIVIGLYDKDLYGATALRECLDLSCLPLLLDINEYKKIMDAADYPFRVKSDFSNLNSQLSSLIHFVKEQRYENDSMTKHKDYFNFKDIIRKRCSFEYTTQRAMQRMDLL